jgi:hypothetical protein
LRKPVAGLRSGIVSKSKATFVPSSTELAEPSCAADTTNYEHERDPKTEHRFAFPEDTIRFSVEVLSGGNG